MFLYFRFILIYCIQIQICFIRNLNFRRRLNYFIIFYCHLLYCLFSILFYHFILLFCILFHSILIYEFNFILEFDSNLIQFEFCLFLYFGFVKMCYYCHLEIWIYLKLRIMKNWSEFRFGMNEMWRRIEDIYGHYHPWPTAKTGGGSRKLRLRWPLESHSVYGFSVGRESIWWWIFHPLWGPHSGLFWYTY